jgi:uncharacterized membrane protein
LENWTLIFAYWLHMAATVVWIGGLFYFSVILAPILKNSSILQKDPTILEAIRRRFNPLAWLSLTVLIVTGLIQMTGNPSYSGLLLFDNTWAFAILLKHIAIIVMVTLAVVQTWILQPRLSRALLLQALHPDTQTDEHARLVHKTMRLTQINLLLGILVLFLTAVARTS